MFLYMNWKKGIKPNEDMINAFSLAFSKTFLKEKKENKKYIKDNKELENDSNSYESEEFLDNEIINKLSKEKNEDKKFMSKIKRKKKFKKPKSGKKRKKLEIIN